MSKNNNFKTIEEALQAVLDKKPLQYDTLIGSMNIDSTESTQSVLESIRQLHWSNFRVKPRVFGYMTRPYMIDRQIFGVWTSQHDTTQQKFEEKYSYAKFEWLACTNKHEVEYL